MDLHHYRFHSRWTLPAPPARVHEILAHPEGYPRWWPQVHDARLSADGRGAGARVRAFLPYDLRITVRERAESTRRPGPEGTGVLAVDVTGDLEGFLRWRLSPLATGTRADFTQEVVVRSQLLRRLALPGRPLFRLNHRLMMRAGERGLRRELSGAGGAGKTV